MIPNRINVLGALFDVKVTGDVPDNECGYTIVADRLIKIRDDIGPELQVETFYHELVHVILQHIGIDYLFTEAENETLAQGIGMALAHIMLANDLPIWEATEALK